MRPATLQLDDAAVLDEVAEPFGQHIGRGALRKFGHGGHTVQIIAGSERSDRPGATDDPPVPVADEPDE